MINWDTTITTYNLTTSKAFDIDYLIKLSNRNAILLNDLKDTVVISQADKYRIETKYENHILNLSRSDWQELSYEHFNYSKRLKK